MIGRSGQAHAWLVAPVGQFIGQQQLGQVIVCLEAVLQKLKRQIGKLSNAEINRKRFNSAAVECYDWLIDWINDMLIDGQILID